MGHVDGRMVGAVSQLALLVFAVVMRFYGLAVFAAAIFLWTGTGVVYELRAGQALPSMSQWVTSQVTARAVSDGAWAVFVGIGAVVLIAGGLIAVLTDGEPGRAVGFAVVGGTSWLLGTVRRARQRSRAEQ
ncbi:MAG: hypothetical protein QOE05_2491 [Actinomycetota bacterium]|jgi:hypothetical protein|nr:hypothetical protein [Actinomycetota bacterium]